MRVNEKINACIGLLQYFSRMTVTSVVALKIVSYFSFTASPLIRILWICVCAMCWKTECHNCHRANCCCCRCCWCGCCCCCCCYCYYIVTGITFSSYINYQISLIERIWEAPPTSRLKPRNGNDLALLPPVGRSVKKCKQSNWWDCVLLTVRTVNYMYTVSGKKRGHSGGRPAMARGRYS